MIPVKPVRTLTLHIRITPDVDQALKAIARHIADDGVRATRSDAARMAILSFARDHLKALG